MLKERSSIVSVEKTLNVSSVESCAYYCQKSPCCAAFAYTHRSETSGCEISSWPPQNIIEQDNGSETQVYETGI